ncbi:MAG: metal-dependent hydrolase [Chloroflexi bacterium]|nr:metal-dependent hydrolase [Chloroflexota bacterium]
MQTQSHFLMTAALCIPLQKRGMDVHITAFLLGSFLPDVPLFVLSAIFGVFSAAAQDGLMSGPAMAEYDRLFFNDPLWIVPHNFFHAPLILMLIFVAGLLFHRRGSLWGNRLVWFALAATLHTGIDILTHHNDGPLLFFPFDFSTRFASPVSYWDPNHYGRIFTRFEMALDLLLVGYLLIGWWRRRSQQSA